MEAGTGREEKDLQMWRRPGRVCGSAGSLVEEVHSQPYVGRLIAEKIAINML